MQKNAETRRSVIPIAKGKARGRVRALGSPMRLTTRSFAADHGDARQSRKGAEFAYGTAKLRSAGIALAIAASPCLPAILLDSAPLRWAAIAWLLVVAVLSDRLARWARTIGPVLQIDARGLRDSRTGVVLRWQEIARMLPVDVDRASVVDIALRWPTPSRDASWSLRLGCFLQRGFGVPAVTVSALMLDGGVADVLAAIERHRPDLLDIQNRCSSSKLSQRG
jgi:hypothetical protein